MKERASFSEDSGDCLTKKYQTVPPISPTTAKINTKRITIFIGDLRGSFHDRSSRRSRRGRFIQLRKNILRLFFRYAWRWIGGDLPNPSFVRRGTDPDPPLAKGELEGVSALREDLVEAYQTYVFGISAKIIQLNLDSILP